VWYLMDSHVDKWLNKEGGKNGEILMMQKLLKDVAFEIVYGCMIDMEMVEGGIEYGQKNGTNMKEVFGWYENWLYGLMSLPFKIKGGGFVKGIEANEKLKQHVIGLMNDENRNKKNEDPIHGGTNKVLSVIDLMVKLMGETIDGQEGKIEFSEADIAQNLIVFLVAGHETVVGAMTYMMRYLGEDKRVFGKLVEEVEGVIKKKNEREGGGEEGKDITMEDLKEMKYCMAVVKEALRCLPPVAMGMREVKKEIELGGYKLFPGELILLNYSGIHENAFSDNDKFIPERWMDEDGGEREEGGEKKKKKDDKSSFVTFAGGDRSCIGMRFALMEMQMLLVNIIMKGYWWKLDPKDQDLSWSPRDGLSCKYKSGMQIKLHKISDGIY